MMMRCNNLKAARLSAKLIGTAALLALLTVIAPAVIYAQGGLNVNSASVSYGVDPSIRQSTLPVVPYRVSRPFQGVGEDETFTQPTDQAPTASFLESIQTNDAAIEIILGQGRLLAIRQDWIGDSGGTAFIGIGDPSIIDFEILPDPHFIRITGLRPGVTDLSIMTPSGEVYCYEVSVGYDLELIRAQLQQLFPNAFIQLGQLRGHIIIEGQARSPLQVSQIIQTLTAFLSAVQVAGSATSGQQAVPAEEDGGRAPSGQGAEGEGEDGQRAEAGPGGAGRTNTSVTMPEPQIINLLRVPGSQQVLLKVKIAELNRTALREIGADMHIASSGGEMLGTSISTASVDALSTLGLGGITGSGSAAIAPSSTVFGIFPGLDFDIIVRALRQNAMMQILAEPNLITLSGTRASILAGGEYPVPVQSATGDGVTIMYKEYGVKLEFLPLILSEERIRLHVMPEVSNIDFSIAATLVDGGSPTPGTTKRSVDTTVELGQGQTLAIGGLLSVEVGGETSRIPGLGDLPYLGPLFGSTTHRRVEKELLVLVTPYIVDAMDASQVGPLPGDEINDPTDDEIYSMSRIEGRMRRPHRSTVDYEYLDVLPRPDYEMEYMSGPVGFSTNR